MLRSSAARVLPILGLLAALLPAGAAEAAGGRLGYTTFSPGYDAFSTRALTPGPGGGAIAGLSLIRKDGKAAIGALEVSATGQPVGGFGAGGLAQAVAGSAVFEDTVDVLRQPDGRLILA